MLSPETFQFVREGGPYLLMAIAIVWLAADRGRLLKSLADKDEIIKAKDAVIAAKDDKLLALSERTIVTMAEFKGLLQSVLDVFNSTKRR